MTEDMQADLISLYATGKPIKEVARKLGISVGYVGEWVGKLGIADRLSYHSGRKTEIRKAVAKIKTVSDLRTVCKDRGLRDQVRKECYKAGILPLPTKKGRPPKPYKPIGYTSLDVEALTLKQAAMKYRGVVSASDIASQFENATRDSVIGYWHRAREKGLLS